MGLLDLQVGFPTLPGPKGGPPGTPDGSPKPSRTSGWVSRPFLDLRVGLPTPPGLLSVPPDPSRTSGWAS